MIFPDDGELYLAAQKKSDHLIFFCHFFKGHKKALRRHIQFANDLGFDCYAFNLKDDLSQHQYLPYSQISKKFGLKHALADQIAEHLKLVEQHPNKYNCKIVFAFSNVSACAIEAIALNNINGVKALICDSGPSTELLYSSFGLAEHQFKLKSPALKALAAPLVVLGWSKDLHKDLPKHLSLLTQDLPILSIRGWKDPMIKPSHIDKTFNIEPPLNWKKLSLPEAGHLNGLRDFEAEYKLGVSEFLQDFLIQS